VEPNWNIIYYGLNICVPSKSHVET
jgi:hypothetical protein